MVNKDYPLLTTWSIVSLTPESGARMTASPDSLTHRMRARVKIARRAADRRAKASRPQVQRTRRALSADPDGPSLVEDREAEALKQVFRDLALCTAGTERGSEAQSHPGCGPLMTNSARSPACQLSWPSRPYWTSWNF